MPHVIAMIPARLGSKRVPKKNLRLFGNKPLIAYAIEATLESGVHDAVYVNSESDILGAVGEEFGAKFYKRPDIHASDAATNDDFALDFINSVACDLLIQILPTSPFITADQIKAFTNKMIDEDYDTLVSTVHHQIACLHQGVPVNFEPLKRNPPSQTMTPVESYATALMGWRTDNLRANMEKYGCAYHGGEGKIGTFELRGLATIDIDREEDFQQAEAIMKAGEKLIATTPRFYTPGSAKRHSEVDVPGILARDGVNNNDFSSENQEVVDLSTILSEADYSTSWSRRLINTDSNSVTLICQLPGEGNRRHYHPDWNEWWYILKGQWDWEIEGEIKTIAEGNVVLITKNRVHKITASGNGPAIRMAVSRADVAHVYPDGPAERSSRP